MSAAQQSSIEPIPAAEAHLYPNAFPRRADAERLEERILEQESRTPSASEAARAYATQRLDINNLHYANNHAVEAYSHLENIQAHNAPLSTRETARTGLQVALENQYQAWQRAYLSSTQNEFRIRGLPHDGPSEEILRRAIRMGIEYLEAEDHLASSHTDSEQPGQMTAAQRRDEALQKYEAAAELANIAIGLPPHNSPRLSAPGQRSSREARHQRRAAAAAAIAAANGAAEPIPVLGHGPNVRPMAAGVLAMIVPHLWIMFKLSIFVYAFTRMDNSWGKIIMILLVALGIFFHNIGLLAPAWAPVADHLQRVLPMADVAQAQRIENGVIMNRNAPVAGAAQGAENARQPAATGNDAQPDGTAGRRRAAEPTPEQYAQRILANQQQEARNRSQANGSQFREMVRMVERDFLLFFMSTIPGIAERHIAAIKAQDRARERAEERGERERENPGQEQEARDNRDVEQREAREDAIGAAAVEGPMQEAQENRYGAGHRLGGNEPRRAAVGEDVFGGVD